MILSSHDSVGPSFRQRGELHNMSVQVDPLNNFESRVMQKPLQMIPHRPSALRFGGNCKPGSFVQEIEILRAQLTRPAKNLHRLTHFQGTAREMDQSFAVEVHVKKSPPIRKNFDG